jgi:6-phosphofructokinase 1
MPKSSKTKCIGILTSGGDCPGLNAAIRGVAKAAMGEFGMKVVGIQDGFRGLVENRTILLEPSSVSGILTRGGTILGTSRDKPNKMMMGGKSMDMTHVAVENLKRLQIDCLVCLGGGGTQKNAYHLHKEGGINILTLPKTIDNDVAGTEITFGFDTAMSIATEALDRLHSTATSHHRIIVCEIMGHNAGWLALGAGIAGGADVILIPEIPYHLDKVAKHLVERRHQGKRFSIIALSEGAVSIEEAKALQEKERELKLQKEKDKTRDKHGDKKKKDREKDKDKDKDKDRKGNASAASFQDGVTEFVAPETDGKMRLIQEPIASRVARKLQDLTGVEARVTSLGHVVRGGTPSATDRLLCTNLGTKAAMLMAEGIYNVMVGVRGNECVPVDLEEVVGLKKLVPSNHPWIASARVEGTCLGDED